MTDLPTVPCRVCSKPTTATHLKICEPCWEVERRLDDFLQHEEGRRIVQAALDRHILPAPPLPPLPPAPPRCSSRHKDTFAGRIYECQLPAGHETLHIEGTCAWANEPAPPPPSLRSYTLGLDMGGLMEHPEFTVEYIHTVEASTLKEAKAKWAKVAGKDGPDWDPDTQTFWGWTVVECHADIRKH